MLKTINLTLFVILAVFLSSAVQAASTSAPPSTVKRYYPQTHTYIQLDENMINPAGCANTWYLAVDSNNPWHEEFRRVFLTALASGKKVTVSISNTPGDCVTNFPRITYMSIER